MTIHRRRTFARAAAAVVVAAVIAALTVVQAQRADAANVRTTKGTVQAHDGLQVRCSVRWVQKKGHRDPIRKVFVRVTRTGNFDAPTALTITTTRLGTAPGATATATMGQGDNFTGAFSGGGNTLTKKDRATTCKVVSQRMFNQETYRSTVRVPKK